MTKVQVQYQLTQPLDDSMLEIISNSHGVYGLQSVRVNQDLDGLTVEYDASRLSLDDVDRAVKSVGLPVVRKS